MQIKRGAPLEDYYVIDPILGCWLWVGGIQGHGYATYKNMRAHIIVYEKYKGKVPAGKHLDHFKSKEGCPRHCVNPDHLEPVTPEENYRRGKRVLLDVKKVKEIKQLLFNGTTHQKIADKFNVTKATITSINLGKNWKDVIL